MSTCKTGCGREIPDGSGNDYLCAPCDAGWEASEEMKRNDAILKEEWDDMHRYDRLRVSLVDFCARMRLERQNGAKT